MTEKREMTREGLEKLEKEYRHLLEVDRPEVIEALKEARAQGDLSENADYDAARNRQAEIEARIAEIEHIRDTAVTIDGEKISKSKKINIGYVVGYKEKGQEEVHYVKLVGTLEVNATADPALISTESALGKALTGHREGDEVKVLSKSPYDIVIVSAVYSA